MGRPKALVVDAETGEPWLHRGVRTLLEAGCTPAIVVLGAAHGEAMALLEETPPVVSAADVRVVVAEEWQTGMAASLRAGIAAVACPAPDGVEIDAAVITLVDLPHLSPAAITRILTPAAAPSAASAFGRADLRTALRQALYGGRPGHPVLVGADHFGSLTAAVSGDTGARPYLRSNGVAEIDCTDLGGGDDIDSPPAHPRTPSSMREQTGRSPG
jgi:molybdenum cofactor cytidylyltransferase